MDNSDTLGVLKKLANGEISAAEADERLNSPPPVERDYSPPEPQPGAPEWVRRLWVYPLAAGLLVVGVGVWMIVATMHANVLWFLCGLPVLLLGTMIVAISAGAQSGHWLYVGINAEGKRRHPIRIAIPFPLGMIRGALAIARFFVKNPGAVFKFGRKNNLNATWEDAEEFVTALERELRQGHVVAVDVNDKNERVQVYIV